MLSQASRKNNICTNEVLESENELLNVMYNATGSIVAIHLPVVIKENILTEIKLSILINDIKSLMTLHS